MLVRLRRTRFVPRAGRRPGAPTAPYSAYQVRFLWRLDFKRLRRLCLFIFRRRFFL